MSSLADLEPDSLADELADMRRRTGERRAAVTSWQISQLTGLPYGEVRDLLDKGRTAQELLALAPRAGRRS